jgi:hypothetical protein
MTYWNANLYDPIYASAIGVSATIASSGGQSGTIRAVDKTTGISIPDARTQIDTVRPVAKVRARELAALGIAVADLPDGTITLNGATWRIKSYQPDPSPEGEADGQIMLILLFEA